MRKHFTSTGCRWVLKTEPTLVQSAHTKNHIVPLSRLVGSCSPSWEGQQLQGLISEQWELQLFCVAVGRTTLCDDRLWLFVHSD